MVIPQTMAEAARFFPGVNIERIAAKNLPEWLHGSGGIGVTKECRAEKFLRDAKVAQIYEGTAFMQLNTIAKHVLK